MKNPQLKAFWDWTFFAGYSRVAHMKRNLLTWIVSLMLFTGGLFAADNAPVRIALLSDIHVLPSTNTDKALHQRHFQQAITEVNAAKVDLVLIAGDLTEFSTPTETSEFMEAKKGFTSPVLYVPGNHDSGNKLTSARPDAKTVTSNRVAQYEAAYGPSFWTQERLGLRIIGVNGSIINSGFEREKEMWAMLEKELAKPSEKTTLVLVHYPPFQRTPDERSGYYDMEPAPRQKFLSLIKQGGVKAVLSGHTHSEAASRLDGIAYITSVPSSYGMPVKKKAGWTLVTVSPAGEIQSEFKHFAD
jgi:3',5'-cyclic AMP phosphodiesterase CpdA